MALGTSTAIEEILKTQLVKIGEPEARTNGITCPSQTSFPARSFVHSLCVPPRPDSAAQNSAEKCSTRMAMLSNKKTNTSLPELLTACHRCLLIPNTSVRQLPWAVGQRRGERERISRIICFADDKVQGQTGESYSVGRWPETLEPPPLLVTLTYPILNLGDITCRRKCLHASAERGKSFWSETARSVSVVFFDSARLLFYSVAKSMCRERVPGWRHPRPARSVWNRRTPKLLTGFRGAENQFAPSCRAARASFSCSVFGSGVDRQRLLSCFRCHFCRCEACRPVRT